jgi:hypothetical protein
MAADHGHRARGVQTDGVEGGEGQELGIGDGRETERRAECDAAALHLVRSADVEYLERLAGVQTLGQFVGLEKRDAGIPHED